MMNLFYKTGACSLASHITLTEIGLPFSIELVDTNTGLTETGKNFHAINPKKYVPALELDNGDILTEGASILQYLADSAPQANLAPPVGSIQRARLHEYLNYTSSELHKAFAPLFSSSLTDSKKETAKAHVSLHLAYINTLLSDERHYLLGEHFSVSDAYLFVVVNWTHFTGIDLNNWPFLYRYYNRIIQRPSVKKAMQAEGL